MKTVWLSQLAIDAGGHLEGEDVAVGGVSTDSRHVQAGDVYFCLRGEKFDGHAFADVAIARGVVAVVAENPVEHAVTQLIVPDTRKAFGLLARLWRRAASVKVIGVTGSNGKTTVKQMVASICQAACADADAVHFTRANDNNEIGVPQTLLGLRDHHRYAVVEMGANLRGEIAWLTKIVEPDIAMITNVSASHLEGFGSVADVANEKGHIFDGLGQHGTAIINLDDAFASQWITQNRQRRIVGFGRSADATVQIQPSSAERLQLAYGEDSLSCGLQLAGQHNWMNAACGAAVGLALALPVAVVAAGLEATQPVKGRLNFHTLDGDFTLIDDTYNANPASTRAAVDVLAVAGGGQRILVLGDLRELGEDAVDFHASVGEYAANAGIDRLYATGPLAKHAVDNFGARGDWFDSREAILAALAQLELAGTTILVKGSRSMQMNRLVDSLLESAETATISAGDVA